MKCFNKHTRRILGVQVNATFGAFQLAHVLDIGVTYPIWTGAQVVYIYLK